MNNTDLLVPAWLDPLAEHGYAIVDQWLPVDLFDQLRAFFQRRQQEDDFDKAGIGAQKDHQIRSRIRGDYVYWLDPVRDGEAAPLFPALEEVQAQLNRYCFLSLSGYEFHLAWYPPGAGYKKHLDQFQGRNNRMISLIVYLNHHWREGDGGELKLYLPDGELLAPPLPNRMVIFKSGEVYHEVLPTRVGRFSLTGWLLHQPAGLGYLLG